MDVMNLAPHSNADDAVAPAWPETITEADELFDQGWSCCFSCNQMEHFNDPADVCQECGHTDVITPGKWLALVIRDTAARQRKWRIHIGCPFCDQE